MTPATTKKTRKLTLKQLANIASENKKCHIKQAMNEIPVSLWDLSKIDKKADEILAKGLTPEETQAELRAYVESIRAS